MHKLVAVAVATVNLGRNIDKDRWRVVRIVPITLGAVDPVVASIDRVGRDLDRRKRVGRPVRVKPTVEFGVREIFDPIRQP